MHRIKASDLATRTCLEHEKEVKGNVDTLTVRSDCSRGMWPRSQCVLPVDSTVDRRPYSSVVIVKRTFLGKRVMPLELPNMVACCAAFRAANYFTTVYILICSVCF